MTIYSQQIENKKIEQIGWFDQLTYFTLKQFKWTNWGDSRYLLFLNVLTWLELIYEKYWHFFGITFSNICLWKIHYKDRFRVNKILPWKVDYHIFSFLIWKWQCNCSWSDVVNGHYQSNSETLISRHFCCILVLGSQIGQCKLEI